ncbi:hypothetical protein CDAR_488601 [Caerostris darwini]|uniref:Reverse transcriptase n=1 Tax=Caerostris darwini TaxID=1538125 RepID=A0AAV4S8T1_9ARAC|nr:hypothetical protein CDAR_488601 [Caerostris darwini]
MKEKITGSQHLYTYKDATLREQENGDGITLHRASKKFGCIGSADDMIVLMESVEGIARQLAIVLDFCNSFHLKLNVRKCKSLLLRREHRVHGRRRHRKIAS